MPFALDGEVGETLIQSRGVLHQVIFTVEEFRHEPVIDHGQDLSPVNSAARITVVWPDLASSILDAAKARFLQVAEDYTWVIPTPDAFRPLEPRRSRRRRRRGKWWLIERTSQDEWRMAQMVAVRSDLAGSVRRIPPRSPDRRGSRTRKTTASV